MSSEAEKEAESFQEISKVSEGANTQANGDSTNCKENTAAKTSSWVDLESEEESSDDKTEKKGADDSKPVDALTEKLFQALDMDVGITPDLSSGELVVREAGCPEGEHSTLPITTFSGLDIDDDLKRAIQEVKGWQTMSKIQQIGLPLILKNPPLNLIGQAQAGTGKTGTFVVSMLARITSEVTPSTPQGIILCVTQELVTQISQEVSQLGQYKGIHARRFMSSYVRKSGPGSENTEAAPWTLNPGEDFLEQVVVGTVGKVRAHLANDMDRRKKKPLINASKVKVLVLDEADQMVAAPPHGFGDQIVPVRDMIMKKRRGQDLQILLFSATFAEEVRQVARTFCGGPSNDLTKYHEITLRKQDMTLDKTVNFFYLVGNPNEENPSSLYIQKYEAILDIWREMSEYNPGQTVVFCNEVARVQECAAYLSRENATVGQIHGRMSKIDRDIVLGEFKAGKRTALVSTNLTSRGIDNPNVTLVINVDLPMHHGTNAVDTENFVHRIGRSGRWTKKGASVSLIARSPKFTDMGNLAEVERALFANSDVDRPMIQIEDIDSIGRILAEQLAAMK